MKSQEIGDWIIRESQGKVRSTLFGLKRAKKDKLFPESEPRNKWRYIRVETVNAAIRLIE